MVETVKPDYLTTKDIASKFNLQEDIIQQAAKRGDLPAVKCGKEWRFNKRKIYELELSGRLW